MPEIIFQKKNSKCEILNHLNFAPNFTLERHFRAFQPAIFFFFFFFLSLVIHGGRHIYSAIPLPPTTKGFLRSCKDISLLIILAKGQSITFAGLLTNFSEIPRGPLALFALSDLIISLMTFVLAQGRSHIFLGTHKFLVF